MESASTDSETLRAIAVAAGKYGFSSSIEDGVLRIQAWDTVIAGTGDAKIRIDLRPGKIVVRSGGVLGSRALEVSPSEPGMVVVAAYYLWLERNRALESRLVKEIVRAARRSAPTSKCPEIVNSIPGLRYREGMCTRIAAMLALGAYKARALLGASVTELGPDRLASVAPRRGALAQIVPAYASLVRTLAPAYERLVETLRAGEHLYEHYGNLPGVLKTGLVLAAYMDRLAQPWHAYVAALSLVSRGVRLVRRCRGPGLVDAALVGEAEWARSGDGTTRCETTSPALLGLSMAVYQRTGSIVGAVSDASGSVRCASSGEPACSLWSIVLDPAERAFRVLSSCLSTLECTARLVYYRGRPLVASIERPGESPGWLTVFILPDSLRLADTVVADRVSRRVEGVPRRLVEADFTSVRGALRALEG